MYPIMPVMYSCYACHELPLCLLWFLLCLLYTHVMIVVWFATNAFIGFYIGLYLLASAYLCSRHSFRCMIMIRFYRYTWTYLCTPSGIHITTRWGEFWLLWILMSRSWSLERVDFPSCWSEWRSGNVDLQQTVQSSILPGPLCASRVFLL